MLRPTKGMDATPLRRRRSPAALLGEASDGGSEGMAQPDPMIDFAELDAHNCLVTSATSRCVVIFGVCRPLPVYPDEQTFSGSVGMSQRCHVWTAPGWQEKSLRRRLGRCCHVFGL